MTTPAQSSRLLEGPLFAPDALPPDARVVFLDCIWPTNSTARALPVTDFDAYFAYVRQKLDGTNPEEHVVKTYNDVVWIITLVSRNFTEKLAVLQTKIQLAYPGSDKDRVSASLELTMQLWLLMNIRVLMSMDKYAMYNSQPWLESQSLQDVLSQITVSPSNNSSGQLDSSNGKFSTYLNAADMEKIAGYRIVWTNRLLDHLDTAGTLVYMFHHVSVLKRLKDSLPRLESIPY